MLHIEAYEFGYRGEPVYWDLNSPKPSKLVDPTSMLVALALQ
jgi:hypothetical protein